jgi:hypothetical protein
VTKERGIFLVLTKRSGRDKLETPEAELSSSPTVYTFKSLLYDEDEIFSAGNQNH